MEEVLRFAYLWERGWLCIKGISAICKRACSSCYNTQIAHMPCITENTFEAYMSQQLRLACILLTVASSRSSSCRLWKRGGFLASGHPIMSEGSPASPSFSFLSSASCSLACLLPARPLGASAAPAPTADKARRKSASVSKQGAARTLLCWYKPATLPFLPYCFGRSTRSRT